jgi:hypothetical protein
VQGRGDVAGGEHVRRAGAQALIHDDAVVDIDPGRLGECGRGRDADSDQHGVGVDRAPA